MRRLASAALLVGLLAGCVAVPVTRQAGPAPVTQYPSHGSECRMAGGQFAVGQLADRALQAEVARRSGAAQVRLLRPGQVITMDFNAQRINLEVDNANRVLAVRCG